ncbi:hypothetical protein [Bacillus sp. FSL K6-6540]|uniref:hypothetical protein n=1 Tax=Bacillus sp. FSL K6-6540 TaxID=2921512 RepID=UPI0030FB1686
MAKHYLGKRVEGVIGRFWPSFTDEEFETLLERIGGQLPRGWVAWHFEEGETIKNSKRVQIVGMRPLIKLNSPVYGLTHPTKEKLEEIMILELNGWNTKNLLIKNSRL